MTKEEIVKSVPVMHIDYNNKDCVRLDDVLKFLDYYVCIPKGINRHPYADVLHKWAEGAEVEFTFKGSPLWTSYEWSDSMQYRIKPSEPVYEYKWRVGCMFGIYTVTEQFLTEEEVGKKPFRKIEETKQVRQ